MKVNKSSFSQILREVAINNRTMLVGRLRDTFPEEKLSVNLILMAFDIGIVNEIRTNEIDNVLLTRLTNKLINNYGVAEKQAYQVVKFWCVAYGVEVLNKSNRIIIPQQPENKQINTPAKITQKASYIQQQGLLDRRKAENGDKYSPSLVLRDLDREKEFGIKSITYTLLEKSDNLTVIGEIVTENIKERTIICFSAFDENDRLINYSTRYSFEPSKITRKYNLDMSLIIDKSLKISKLKLYPMKDPAWAE